MTRIQTAFFAAGSLAVFVSTLATSPVAAAPPLSARDLVAACSGDTRARAMCDGYLMALTDAEKIREDRGRGGRVCLPDSLTVDQIRAGVLDFANRAPAGQDTARVPGTRDQGARQDQTNEREPRRHRGRRREGAEGDRAPGPAQDQGADARDGTRPAIRLIAAALRANWPCRDGGGRDGAGRDPGGRDPAGRDGTRDGGRRDGGRDGTGGGPRNP